VLNFTYTPFILPLLVATAIALLIAAYVLPRRRAQGAMALVEISIAIALWALGYALEIAGTDLPTKYFWGQFQYLGIAFIPYLWLLFARAYTHQFRPLPLGHWRWLIVWPLTTLILALTNPWHGLIWSATALKQTDTLLVLDITYGLGFWINVVFSYTFLVVGAYILLSALRQGQQLYRAQAVAVIIAVIFTWLGNIVHLSGLSPIPELDPTPFAFTLTLIALTWAVFGYRLGDIAPIARDLVIEGLREGMIVLDIQGRIADINPAAAHMIGLPTRQVLGKTVEEALAPWPHLAKRFKAVLEGQDEITVGQGETQRRYAVRITPLQDRQQRLLGRVAVIREVIISAATLIEPPLHESPTPAVEVTPPAEPLPIPQLGRFGVLIKWLLPAIKPNLTTPPGTNPLLTQSLERAFTIMLRFAALFGTLALLVHAPTILPEASKIGILLLFGCILILLWGLSLARQINFNYRTNIFLLLFYTLALAEVVYYGYSVEAFMYFLVLVALAVLLRGQRNGLIMLGISLFTLASFGWQIGRGHYIPPSAVDTPIAPRTIEFGLANLLVFLATATTLLMTSSVLLRSINKAWQQETQALNLLQQERDLLEGRVVERTRDLAEVRDRAVRSRDEMRKYFLALEQSGNTVVITDTEGAIEYANPRFEELTGYSRAEALGNTPRILKSGEHDAAYYKTLWNTISTGKIWHGEFLNRRKDGTLFWETATIAPLTNNVGAITHYVAVKEDITERKESEAALRRYAEELQASNTELDAFAHTVAHDLKNPLTVVVGFSELLSQRLEALSPQIVRENLDRITTTGHKMVSIINELLLLSGIRKIEDVPRRPLDMGEIITEVQKRLMSMLAEYETHLIVPTNWPVALGHAPWIEEVWINYISNALKYGGQPPQVKLGYTMLEAKTSLPEAGESSDQIPVSSIKFWVRDNGPGLTQEEQAQLFTQFTRLHEMRAEGHGLGLSIVERIVKKLDGEVGVESLPDGGSSFWFTLPAETAPPDSARA